MLILSLLLFIELSQYFFEVLSGSLNCICIFTRQRDRGKDTYVYVEVRGNEKEERETEFHWLIYSPNAINSHGWEVGARNSTQVSCMNGRDPTTLTIICCIHAGHEQEAGIWSGTAAQTRQFKMRLSFSNSILIVVSKTFLYQKTGVTWLFVLT